MSPFVLLLRRLPQFATSSHFYCASADLPQLNLGFYCLEIQVPLLLYLSLDNPSQWPLVPGGDGKLILPTHFGD